MFRWAFLEPFLVRGTCAEDEDPKRRPADSPATVERFWRVRGSSFYPDPEAAMRGLWPLLDELAGATPDETARRPAGSRGPLPSRGHTL
jgi:hypothetical protein